MEPHQNLRNPILLGAWFVCAVWPLVLYAVTRMVIRRNSDDEVNGCFAENPAGCVEGDLISKWVAPVAEFAALPQLIVAT